MKNKILILVFAAIILSSFAIGGNSFEYNVGIAYDPAGNLAHYGSVAWFLSDLLYNYYDANLYYGADLENVSIIDFADYFQVTANSYSGEILDLNEGAFILIGSPSSSLIKEEIRSSLGDFGDDAILVYDESEEYSILYIIINDTKVLSSLLSYLEDYPLFKELRGSIVYYNNDTGFEGFEDAPCNPTKERDSGTGGDFPERYGCLNNGVDWMCDTCVDKKTLVEFYCLENVSVMKAYNCQSCNYGVCKPECQERWLDEYSCQASTSIFRRGQFDIMRAYQTKTLAGAWTKTMAAGTCTKIWKVYKSCGKTYSSSWTYECNTYCSSAQEVSLTARAVSEETSGVNIFSKIADFFRNLFG